MGRKPERGEPLKKYTLYLRRDQLEFLRTQGNVSQFVREAIDKAIETKVSEVMSREAKIINLTKKIKEIELKIGKLENNNVFREASRGLPPDIVIKTLEGAVSDISKLIQLAEEGKLPTEPPENMQGYYELEKKLGVSLTYLREFYREKPISIADEHARISHALKSLQKKSEGLSKDIKVVNAFDAEIKKLQEEKEALEKQIREL